MTNQNYLVSIRNETDCFGLNGLLLYSTLMQILK